LKWAIRPVLSDQVTIVGYIDEVLHGTTLGDFNAVSDPTNGLRHGTIGRHRIAERNFAAW